MTMAADGFGGDSGVVADAQLRVVASGAAAPTAPGVTGQAADEAVTAAYQTHYDALVRTAATLVGDVATAEDVVQESFIALHRSRWRLREPSRVVPHLRRSVINNSRSMLRRWAVPDRHLRTRGPDLPSAEESALVGVQRS